MTMSGVSSDGAIDVDATGVVDFASRAGEMQMRMTSPATGSVLRMREITLWPVVYMRSSLFASEPHSKGPWVRLDLARLERRHGVNVNALANAERGTMTLLCCDAARASPTRSRPSATRWCAATKDDPLPGGHRPLEGGRVGTPRAAGRRTPLGGAP